MKAKYVYIITTLIIAGFSGCKKGSSNKSTAPSSSSYFPVTAGSSWVYDDVTAGVTGTVTITMTGATSVINGKTYYAVNLVSSSQGTETGYYYNADHEFASRSTHATPDGSVTFELQEGNDAEPAGYTWTTSPSDIGTIGGLPARCVNTIKEKNITKVENGKTFNNVIHTLVDLQYNAGSGFESVTTYDFYLAPGVGLIEDDIAQLGSVYDIQTIKSYTIK